MGIQGGELTTLAAYNRQLEQRIKEQDINNVDVYSAMLRLTSKKYEALRLPVMLDNITARPSGVYVVSLCMLDEHFKKMLTTGGMMIDGMWMPARDDPFKFERPINGRAVEGYLTDYSDGVDISELMNKELISASVTE
ncbi:MAG: hypothetical protein ABIQ04_01485 [Candidatus Saccharimonadales bacterium]